MVDIRTLGVYLAVYVRGEQPMYTVAPSVSYARSLAYGSTLNDGRRTVTVDAKATYVMLDAAGVVLESGLVCDCGSILSLSQYIALRQALEGGK